MAHRVRGPAPPNLDLCFEHGRGKVNLLTLERLEEGESRRETEKGETKKRETGERGGGDREERQRQRKDR